MQPRLMEIVAMSEQMPNLSVNDMVNREAYIY